MSIGGIAAESLRQLIERIERLEEEKAQIAADIKEVYAQAKGQGFDTKTMRQIVKLRKLEQHERDEQEALLDIYKAALGMLNGTPLGDAAVRRLSTKPPAPAPEPDDGQSDIEDFASTGKEEDADAPDAEPEAPREPEPKPEPEPTIEDARTMGRDAAVAGQPVTENPFPARDPRRAVWDEEWCKASGSDGMDLPAAWRRSAKPAKADPEDRKAN